MRILPTVIALLLVGIIERIPLTAQQTGRQPAAQPAAAPRLSPQQIDGLVAPVALYPDQLLAQLFISATLPPRVKELDAWLKTNPPFKGSALQDAAHQKGFEPSLVALVLFPQVVDFLTENLDWTTEVGQAFSSDRPGVLDSVQRLRADAIRTGKLTNTEQHTVTLRTTPSGQNVVVIEPTNPQIAHVPQYDTQAVYSQAPTSSTTVIIKEDDDDAAEAAAAGLIGFTAGVVIGAAVTNPYYYGPYGWHGAPYMYNDAWDDYYDHREDAREDWYDNRDDARDDLADHREDMADERGDRRENTSENRTDRRENASENRGDRAATSQQQRTDRQAERSGTGAQASTAGSSQANRTTTTQNRSATSAGTARSGTRSDAFSNYSSGRSERAASSRGNSSRSSSRSGGGRSRR
jgi:hypothetical protein